MALQTLNFDSILFFCIYYRFLLVKPDDLSLKELTIPLNSKANKKGSFDVVRKISSITIQWRI